MTANTAFEELLEELEDEMGVVNQAGAFAFGKGDHEAAEAAVGRAKHLTALRLKVSKLRDEWNTFHPAPASVQIHPDGYSQVDRGHSDRLQRGKRTPERVFEIPILKALVEMGGRARMGEVLVRVEQLMRDTLKPVDYESLKSSSDPRWRNTGQWARNTMVEHGLLRSDSPWGFWEITDAGRRYLAEHSD